MPFKSKKQEDYLRINEPKVYKKWKKRYNKGGIKEDRNEFSNWVNPDQDFSTFELEKTIKSAKDSPTATTLNVFGRPVTLTDKSTPFSKKFIAESGSTTLVAEKSDWGDAEALVKQELELRPGTRAQVLHTVGEGGRDASAIHLQSPHVNAGLLTDWNKDDAGYIEGKITTDLGRFEAGLSSNFMKDETGKIFYRTPNRKLEFTGFTDFENLQHALVKAKEGEWRLNAETDFGQNKDVRLSYNRPDKDDIFRDLFRRMTLGANRGKEEGWSGEYRTDLDDTENLEVDYTQGPVTFTGETNFGGDDSRQKLTVEIMEGPITITGVENFDDYESLGVKYSKDNLSFGAKTNFDGSPYVDASYNTDNFKIGVGSDLHGKNVIRAQGSWKFNKGGMAGCPMDGAVIKGGTTIKPDRYTHGKRKVKNGKTSTT